MIIYGFILRFLCDSVRRQGRFVVRRRSSKILLKYAAVEPFPLVPDSRISHEIVERNGDGEELCIVGIMRRGAPLADILAARVRSLGAKVEIGYLDITLYRDDLSEDDDQPRLNETKIDFSVSGKTVIMVDDVLYTGRTARAAMDAIISLGRPAKIQFAALIDRGHRELPIVADYVGKNVPTSRSEVIVVKTPPFDEEVSVSIWQK